ALSNEVVKGAEAVARDLPAREKQQVGPLVSPVVDELRPREEALDDPCPFFRGRIGREAQGLPGGGQEARGIQGSPRQELEVAGGRRRGDLEGLELSKDVVIGVVVPFGLEEGFIGHGAGERGADSRKIDLALKPKRDRRLA